MIREMINFISLFYFNYFSIMILITQFEPLEIPEFAKDGRYHVSVTHDSTEPFMNMRFPKNNIDSYITKINIPQEKLKFEKTDYNFINFENEETYGDISIRYRDDVHLTMTTFFQDWLDSIYNKEKRFLYSDWRTRYKDFRVELRNSLYGQKTIKSWDILRCYPQEIKELEFSDDGDGNPIDFEVSLVCERVISL